MFEFVGVEVTNWLWNDVLGTDQYRWRVLPAAVLLGFVLTALFKIMRQQRITPVDTDLAEEIQGAPSTIPTIAAILAIGAMSLLAGGSIGPEASLMLASAGIGIYTSKRWGSSSLQQPIILASIGALLVAFLDSFILILIPILLFKRLAEQQKSRLQLKPIILIVTAGGASYVTLYLINYVTGTSGGYGTTPSLPAFQLKDLVIAVVIGFAAGLLGYCLTWFMQQFYKFAMWLETRNTPGIDWIAGLGFSVVLGLLYLIGGQTIQFSGSAGSSLLVQEVYRYGAFALFGLIITKILATAWSKATGYRGGLVFPSIYVGVALGLLASNVFSELSGAGVFIGGIAGMLGAAIGSPVLAGIFLIAILPWKLWIVGFCAIIGTVLFSRIKLHWPYKISKN